jgi:hypothetical protein
MSFSLAGAQKALPFYPMLNHISPFTSCLNTALSREREREKERETEREGARGREREREGERGGERERGRGERENIHLPGACPQVTYFLPSSTISQ